MINLSKLEEVKDLRNVWHDEARDFTPWLVKEDNIALLADAIGIDIEVKERESSVGSFQRRAWLGHGCLLGVQRIPPATDMAAQLAHCVSLLRQIWLPSWFSQCFGWLPSWCMATYLGHGCPHSGMSASAEVSSEL